MGGAKERRTRKIDRARPQQPAARTVVPIERADFRRDDYLAAALTCLAAFVVYLLTVAPTVTAEDSGELIAAAYTLGIPHPPGYPLWCMLGKLFTLLIPFSSIAWRVNVESAFFGSLTAGVICLITVRITRNRFAGVASGLVLAFSNVFWGQCVIAEVYSLNSFLIALCILILVVWQETQENTLLYAFAAVYGLGMCNHHTVHFLGPMFALFIMAVHGRPWRYWKPYLWMLGIAFGVWLAVHLYLPLRAMADPPLKWENPVTWDSFWHLVLRRVYRYGFIDKPHSVGRVLEQIWVFVALYGHQFTLGLAALPLAGLYPLWKLCRRRFMLITGIFLYIAAGFIAVLNFDMTQNDIDTNSVFFIPTFMMAAILMGVAVAWGAGLKRDRFPFAAVGLVLAVAVPAVPLAANYHGNNKSDYYFAYDYAMNTFATLDENTVYFPHGDRFMFPQMYLQIVEGVRPDVSIGRKYGEIEELLFTDMPLDLRNRLIDLPRKYDDRGIQDWIVANTDRPVFFTEERPIPSIPGSRMFAAGLVYRTVIAEPGKPPEAWAKRPPDRDYWNEYTWHTLDEADIRGDTLAMTILSDCHLASGRSFLDKGKTHEGLDEIDVAIRIASNRVELLNNIGSICFTYQQYDAAKKCYLKVLNIDPDFKMSLWNLAVIYNIQGEFGKAKTHLDHVIKDLEEEYGPRYPDIAPCSNDLGGTLLAQRDYSGARERLERALSIDESLVGPDSAYVARDVHNLSVVLAAMGDTQTAQKYRARAEEICAKFLGERHPLTPYVKQGQFCPSMVVR